jgi:hypothetical protein
MVITQELIERLTKSGWDTLILQQPRTIGGGDCLSAGNRGR